MTTKQHSKRLRLNFELKPLKQTTKPSRNLRLGFS